MASGASPVISCPAKRRAPGRAVQAGDHVEERRFARPVRADDREHFAGGNREAHVGERGQRAEVFDTPLHLQQDPVPAPGSAAARGATRRNPSSPLGTNSTMNTSTSPTMIEYHCTYDETFSWSTMKKAPPMIGPDQRSQAPDHHHDDELARDAPVHEIRRGVGRPPRVEGAGEPRQHRRDHAHPHLVALHVVAEKSRAVLVLADRDEHLAEVGRDQRAAHEYARKR